MKLKYNKEDLYLVEINDDYFSYEKAVETLHLYKINNFLSDKELPLLNGNDKQMLINSGGIVIYIKSKGNIIWLINLNHEQDKKIGVILGDDLLEIISSIRNKIKRDLKLNNILKNEIEKR